jgi:hypothetical protein
MKIWIKNPDPNHQCCDCSARQGPCDSCFNCLIFNSGIYPNFFMDYNASILNLFNNNCLIVGPVSSNCSVCSEISSFSYESNSDISYFASPRRRQFPNVIQNPIGIVSGGRFPSVIDGSQKISITTNASYTGTRKSDNYSGIFESSSFDYSIQSTSDLGLTFIFNPINNIDFPSTISDGGLPQNNSEQIISQFVLSPRILTSVNSGDIFSFSTNGPISSDNPLEVVVGLTSQTDETLILSGLTLGGVSPDQTFGFFEFIFLGPKPMGYITFDSGQCVYIVLQSSFLSPDIVPNPPPLSINLKITNAAGSGINPLSQFSNLPTGLSGFFCPNLP